MTLPDLRQPPPRGSYDYLLGPIAHWREPPQSPPEPPRRRGVITIQVELCPPPAPARRPGRLWLAVLVWLLVLAALGHAQPVQYQHWQNTNGWHGEERRQGNSTSWTEYGPKGQQHSCDRYRSDKDTFTTCR